MSRVTLADPALSEIVPQIEHVAVEIDEYPDLASRHVISAVPAFIMLSTADDEVEGPTSFQAVCDFLPWLTSGISEATAPIVRQALAMKSLADVDQMLASTETNQSSWRR